MLRNLGARPPARPLRADFAEKRRHPRRPARVRCWIADGKSTLYARVHDVSLGGFCVHGPLSFMPGAELEVALMKTSVDGSAPNGIVAVRARGRVAWVSAGGDRRIGATFTHFLVGENALVELVG